MNTLLAKLAFSGTEPTAIEAYELTRTLNNALDIAQSHPDRALAPDEMWRILQLIDLITREIAELACQQSEKPVVTAETDAINALSTPQPLDYYRNVLRFERDAALDLVVRPDECAVILQAFDYGIKSLDDESIDLLEQFIATAKRAVYP